MPPTRTKPCRTRSSRSSAISGPIGRRGRSRSGSPAFSSTAVSTGARRARRRERWFAPADEATGADEAAPVCPAPAPPDPEARLLARERARASPRRRSARRPAAHRVHALPLRRLHAAGGQRDDRPERVDRPRASVPRRAQAARPPGRQAMMRRRATSTTSGCSTATSPSGMASRWIRRPPSIWPTAPTARARYARARARSWTSCARDGRSRNRCRVHAERLRGAAAADRAAPRALGPRRARHQLPRPRRRRRVTAPAAPRRAALDGRGRGGRAVRRRRRRRLVDWQHADARRRRRPSPRQPSAARAVALDQALSRAGIAPTCSTTTRRSCRTRAGARAAAHAASSCRSTP